MTEFEFMLNDRIAKIQAINAEYNLMDNAYISYSGGKDSTVLNHLIDLALPQNNIKRVFINTAIEYKDLLDHVKQQQQKDSRIEIVNANINIKEIIQAFAT